MALHITAAVIIGGLHSWPHWVQMFLTISCCRNFVLHACTTYLSHKATALSGYTVCTPALSDYCGHSMLTTLQQACWVFFYSDSHTHLWNGYTAVKLDQSKCSAPSEARHSSVLFFYLEGQLASASPRTQAPTVAPSVLFPIQPGALLRH